MKYNDGYQVDENMRIIKCPKCENEVFSDDAYHCKICGTKLFNECEGEPEYDGFGNIMDYNYHNNPGNARFCEQCGKPTYFFKAGFLKPWEEAKEEIEALVEMGLLENEEVSEPATEQHDDDEDNGDLPF